MKKAHHWILVLLIILISSRSAYSESAKKDIYLFSIDIKYQQELDNAQINEDLMREFEKDKNPLSKDVTLKVEEKSTVWLIEDKESGQKYWILKEDNRLNIYALSSSIDKSTETSTDAAATDTAPNKGAISINAGNDFVTQYYFRGLFLENQGFISQPYATVGIKLYEGEKWLNKISFNIGTWNSIHSSDPTGTGSDTQDPRGWFESDFYAGFSFDMVDFLRFEAKYAAYMSPNDSFKTIQEMIFKLSLNDSALINYGAPFSISPYAMIATELCGACDGLRRGTYLELGLEPAYTFKFNDVYSLTLSLPVAFGFSLHDYYEDPVTEDDDCFGYADLGIRLGFPLAFIPAKYGSWNVSATVHFLFLNGNTVEFNEPPRNDDFEIIGTIGLSMNY